MAGDDYRAPGIHVNKTFIEDPNNWLELSNLQLQGRTMYNNSYPNSGYSSAYPAYQQNYDGSYNYQGYPNQYNMPPNQANSGNYQQNAWPTSVDYGAPPPPPEPKQDAVAAEMLQQRAQLAQQRHDYVRKAAVLRRELDQLRNQKQELMMEGDPDRDLSLILKENDKLQEEILGKLKAIYNVIEMLSSIIKDGKSLSDLEIELNNKTTHSKSTENYKEERKHSPSVEDDSNSKSKKHCYVFYDTGLHWCRSCDEFPETAKEFLQHLQSETHRESAKENEVDTTPWHKMPMEPILPSYDDAPKKRIPIKGLQFFIPAPAWYCKLCDVWIGDLHCASHHLKSEAHFQNYEIFVQQNPHWEMEWLKDREKAMARNGESDEGSKKKKRRKSLEKLLAKKKKKKSKKRRKHSSDSSSSSSSSDSSSDDDKEDKSKSIRVAMRNVNKVQNIMNEDMTKWNVLEKILQEHRKKEEQRKEAENKKNAVPEKDDELINQWMTVSEPVVKDRSMIESLKDRMKAKQELEKQKYMELERIKKEKEKQEREVLEKRQKELREKEEMMERERKRKEQEEYERITDKDRNQVRFKTARENYRRRRSNSRSDNEDDKYKERSRSPRYRKDSEKSYKSQSPPDSKKDDSKKSSYKRLPFIGRMPLFKNKKPEEKPVEKKEIKKEEYEPQRRTRFEPGNLPRAFIPQPDVVRFPQLSCIPPLMAPPPPPVVKAPSPPPRAPEPPSISPPKAPSPPAFKQEAADEEVAYPQDVAGQYYQGYDANAYSHAYDFPQGNGESTGVPLAHTMPLEPPPLPPDDDLAMLGICADDMAAQSF